MKKINNFLNSPPCKIIINIFTIIGIIVSIISLIWGSNKIIQSFRGNTFSQSPTITNSSNITFSYDNSINNAYGSIVTVDPNNPEISVLRSMAEKNGCSWKKIENSENQVQWNCTPAYTFKIENNDNSPQKNIRINLPDGKKIFVPFIAAKNIVILGACTKGNEHPECSIDPFYSINKYENYKVCTDIFLKWGEFIPEFEKVIPLECEKG